LYHGDILSVGRVGIRFQKRIRWVLAVEYSVTMASFSLPLATITSFQPLISTYNQKRIVAHDACCARIRARKAASAALLQHIREMITEKRIVDTLLKKVGDPYIGCVSDPLFSVCGKDRVKIEGYGYEHTMRALIVWGTMVQSLNEGLGPNFRVVRECEGDTITLLIEFRPSKPVMNPEEEEEVIELPMRPRTSSIESE